MIPTSTVAPPSARLPMASSLLLRASPSRLHISCLPIPPFRHIVAGVLRLPAGHNRRQECQRQPESLVRHPDIVFQEPQRRTGITRLSSVVIKFTALLLRGFSGRYKGLDILRFSRRRRVQVPPSAPDLFRDIQHFAFPNPLVF